MDLIYITNCPKRARTAEQAGVDRIMVDLESIGKDARQGHLKTVISRHTFDDVAVMRVVLATSRLMVRVNPIHEGSSAEIARVLDLGADIVMLPMFRAVSEVRDFVRFVGGRARCCLLLETGAALARIHPILDVPGIDEMHIGLNDLHLDLKLNFMFELLSGGLVDYLAAILRERNCKFGFGGVARLGHGTVSADLVLSEHRRLGSTQVILSRDFGQLFEDASGDQAASRFAEEVARIRSHLEHLATASPEQLECSARELRAAVAALIR